MQTQRPSNVPPPIEYTVDPCREPFAAPDMQVVAPAKEQASAPVEGSGMSARGLCNSSALRAVGFQTVFHFALFAQPGVMYARWTRRHQDFKRAIIMPPTGFGTPASFVGGPRSLPSYSYDARLKITGAAALHELVVMVLDVPVGGKGVDRVLGAVGFDELVVTCPRAE